MPIPDILFKGVPRRYTRGYTADVIRAVRPEKIVIPCVGAYALATTCIEAGIAPNRIEACDISLYSSVIGAMLSDNHFRLEPLGQWADVFGSYLQDGTETSPAVAVRRVAAVVVGIRICQYQAKRDTLYTRERIREVRDRLPYYLEQAYGVAAGVGERLHGLQYRAEDMWDLLGRHRAYNERTLILLNPPRYTGGYDKMYQGVEAMFDWDEPSVQQFTEDGYEPLVRLLDEGPRTLLYYATPADTAEDPSYLWGHPWRSVFAARPKTGRTAAVNWIVSNRPDATKALLHRSDIEDHVKAKYKLFSEGEITPNSVLQVVPETKQVSSYYRDLLVHNLPMANAERYKVLLLDGKLLATVGLHLQNLRAGGSMQGIAKLRFAFSCTHPQYARLHKLTLLSVVSSWFFEEEIGDIEEMPRAVQTTMLTPYPEAKTARGIFRRVATEYDEELRMNKITYYADLVHRTPQETVREWLRRWGQVSHAPTLSQENG